MEFLILGIMLITFGVAGVVWSIRQLKRQRPMRNR